MNRQTSYFALDSMKELETDRLLLRHWHLDDAPTLYKYASDPELGPRAGWAPHQSVEESIELISTIFDTDTMWAIELKDVGEAMGCIGYLLSGNSNVPLAPDEAEVGYWVARPYWNMGICTEALRELLDYCFLEKCFSSLYGDCFLDNPASERVMVKCGFVEINTLPNCKSLDVGSDKPIKLLGLSRESYLSDVIGDKR